MAEGAQMDFCLAVYVLHLVDFPESGFNPC